VRDRRLRGQEPDDRAWEVSRPVVAYPEPDHTQPPPAPQRVTRHTQTIFHPNHLPATGTFTSTGGPGSLCSSGTFADQPVQPITNGLVLNETFSCAHGNKAVEIRDTIHFEKIASDGSQTSTDTWRAVNLGDRMNGSGHGEGVATGCTPVGSTFATSCTRAVGVLTGRLNAARGARSGQGLDGSGRRRLDHPPGFRPSDAPS
jgi:hypothetical protein